MDIPGTEGINVYADAKTEYTRQLSQFTQSALLEYFLKLLDETKESEKESKKLLLSFQNSLKQIPEWNYEKVQKETTIILKKINCDYYDDLLSAVFVAHTKVLSAIRLTSRQKKLQITIPKIDHFLHHTLIECARILWSNVYLFTPSGSPIDRQKNFRQIETLIQDGILQSIRSMLPVKNILKEYLKDDEDDDEDVKEVEKEEVKDAEKEEVKENEVEAKDAEKEEAKEEVKVEVKEDEVEVKENEVEVKEEEPPAKKETEQTEQTEKTEKPEHPEIPVISVDTEPSVKFAEVNTIIDIEANENENENENDSDEESEEIKILDDSGEALNEFENLEEESIEFETL